MHAIRITRIAGIDSINLQKMKELETNKLKGSLITTSNEVIISFYLFSPPLFHHLLPSP